MPDDLGKCPGCNETGTVGEPCSEKGCRKREYRFIPDEYFEDAHGSDGNLRDAKIGQMIGDFLVVGVLGEGGFGTVYLALQQPLFRLRGALKLIEPPEDNADFAEAILEKFQGEAEVLADLGHPNIVRLLKYGIHRRRPYLVMEYVEDGVTLRDEIYRRAHEGEPLAHEELRHIFTQMLNGLEAAHDRGVIHRDIKPENIMLQPVVGNPAHVRILDFGLAKAVEKRADTDWMLGSPTYMAPEQVNRENLGTWSDLYGLGVIFYELITGRKPFPGDTDAEIVARKLDEVFDPFDLVDDAELDDRVLQFMEKALEPTPEARYQTVAEFRSAMETAFDAMEGDSSAVGPGSADLTMLVDSDDVLEIVDDRRATPSGRSGEADEAAPSEPPPVTDEQIRDEVPGEAADEDSSIGLGHAAFAASLALVLALGVYVGLGMDRGPVRFWDDGAAAGRTDAPTDGGSSDTDAADTSADEGLAGPLPAPGDTDLEADGELDADDGSDGDALDVEADTGDADTGPALPDDAFVDVSAGNYHSCGLRADDGIRCWGGNFDGELGLGHTDTIGDDEPAREAALLTFDQPVDQLLAAGDRDASYTCVRLASGAAGCWGANADGQLGLGHARKLGNDLAIDSISAVDLEEPVDELAAGASKYGSHVCARLASGDIRCWGNGKFGKLGYGHTNVIGDDELPSTTGLVDVGGEVRALAAGKYTTCVLLANDDLRCWGWNKHGQLGLGHTDDIGDDERPTATSPIAVGGTPVQLDVGRRHACAVLVDGGRVRCWGWNKHGQLGLRHTDDIGDDERPADAELVELAAPATRISAGGIHNCALLETGEVQCWGDNRFGQLGLGHEQTIGDNEAPATAGTVSLDEPARAVATGNFHTCVATESGDIRCWGLNKFGQLGYGHTNVIGNDEPPSSVSPVPAR